MKKLSLSFALFIFSAAHLAQADAGAAFQRIELAPGKYIFKVNQGNSHAGLEITPVNPVPNIGNMTLKGAQAVCRHLQLRDRQWTTPGQSEMEELIAMGIGFLEGIQYSGYAWITRTPEEQATQEARLRAKLRAAQQECVAKRLDRQICQAVYDLHLREGRTEIYARFYAYDLISGQRQMYDAAGAAVARNSVLCVAR